MKRLAAALVAALLLAAPAYAWIGENGASMTLNGTATSVSCTYNSNGHCPSMTLAWDKGTNSYYPYAIYRLRSDNMIGADSTYPGAQLACPVSGSGSTTITPTIMTQGAVGIYRYVLVVDAGTPNPTTCAHLDSLSGYEYVIGEVDLYLNPP